MQGYYDVTLFDCPPFRMFDNDDDPRSVDILVNKKFEPHSTRLWCALVSEATCILDIGAHTGIYSLVAASLRSDIEIHAFEPNPYSAARLRVHKHLNGFSNIRDYHLALSDQKGVIPVTWTKRKDGWLSSNSGIFVRPNKVIETDCALVSDLDSLEITYGGTPLVKIDVENSETYVFRGMQKLLAARPVIFLETFRQESCDEIGKMLIDYRSFRIHEAGSISELERLEPAHPKSDDFNQLLVPNERYPGIKRHVSSGTSSKATGSESSTTRFNPDSPELSGSCSTK